MSNAKVIRGQVRQVVQEILGDILVEQLYKQLEHKLAQRVEGIELYTKQQLEAIKESNSQMLMQILVKMAEKTKADEEAKKTS